MRRGAVLLVLLALVGSCLLVSGCTQTEDGMGFEAHYEFEF